MLTEPSGSDWVEVTEEILPVAEVMSWVVLPECGALVSFCGTVRDNSEGRDGVVSLDYEAYLEQAVLRLCEVGTTARSHWAELGRIALLHRVGKLRVGELSVVIAVSSPHRAVAFDAARFCIEAVKRSVPIWKRETWSGGSEWGQSAYDVQSAKELQMIQADELSEAGDQRE